MTSLESQDTVSNSPVSIKLRLSQTIKTAMKAEQKDILSYARNLHASIRKKEIDERVDLDDEQVQQIILGLLKQRADSLEHFEKANRQDLVKKEQDEIAFLKTFLPEPISDDQLILLIKEAIEQVQATQLKDMSSVLNIVLPQVGARGETKHISELIKKVLLP